MKKKDLCSLNRRGKLSNMSKNESKKSSLKRKKKVKFQESNNSNPENSDLCDSQPKSLLINSKEKVKKKSILKMKKNRKVISEVAEVTDELSSLNNSKEKGKKKSILKKKKKAITELAEVTDEINETKSLDESENIKEKKTKKGILIQRSEPAQNISEYSLNEVGKERVKLDELVKASQKLAGQLLVKKQLQNAKKLRSLAAPLSKPQLEKIKRTVAYEKVCDEVSKWDSVVESNRSADQIVFPLKKPDLRLESFENVAAQFVSKHPVQEAVSKLLNNSENTLNKSKELTPAEEKALQAMSLEEAKLRHSELMKHRALLSYKEAKARRQNKIKSKRYHRILKREKLKKMMKEFEELQKTDAAAALEKFLEADKQRVLERMTLKHRNTGKWAKLQKLRAKYNPESRSSLKEDLIIGRELKKKLAVDEEVLKSKADVAISYSLSNKEPDMSLLPNRGLLEDVSNNNDIESLFEINEDIQDSLDTEEFPHILQHFAETDKLKSAEENKSETKSYEREQSSSPLKLIKVKDQLTREPVKSVKKAKTSTAEDDMDFSSEVTCLQSMVPDEATFGDEDLDDQEEGKITIQQAFADEDFIAEFKEEKKAVERANKPEAIDLFLPGWGKWGGPGIKVSRKRKKRFLIKPVEVASKKSTLGNVILNEERDKKASIHQVSTLPFPFTNIHQFESYIRQPIGNTWNPQSSFQNLVAPKVITKMGKVIEPIEAEDVILKSSTKKSKTKKTKTKKRPKKTQKQLNAF